MAHHHCFLRTGHPFPAHPPNSATCQIRPHRAGSPSASGESGAKISPRQPNEAKTTNETAPCHAVTRHAAAARSTRWARRNGTGWCRARGGFQPRGCHREKDTRRSDDPQGQRVVVRGSAGLGSSATHERSQQRRHQRHHPYEHEGRQEAHRERLHRFHPHRPGPFGLLLTTTAPCLVGVDAEAFDQAGARAGRAGGVAGRRPPIGVVSETAPRLLWVSANPQLRIDGAQDLACRRQMASRSRASGSSRTTAWSAFLRPLRCRSTHCQAFTTQPGSGDEAGSRRLRGGGAHRTKTAAATRKPISAAVLMPGPPVSQSTPPRRRPGSPRQAPAPFRADAPAGNQEGSPRRKIPAAARRRAGTP